MTERIRLTDIELEAIGCAFSQMFAGDMEDAGLQEDDAHDVKVWEAVSTASEKIHAMRQRLKRSVAR